MRGLKLGLVIFAAAMLTLAFGGLAYAFHSGGVAECTGCHSMHSPAAGGTFLLLGTDQSSTCLTCHEHAGDTGPSSYHISTAPADMTTGNAPKQRTPGGDFGWLKKTYTFSVRGTSTTEDGATHGHNIVAVDKGYSADPSNATSPGGSFPSSQLACNSCHDPHGQYRRLNTGAISKTGGPIKASGSYNGANGANEPDAANAVGVYRLLAGAGYTKGGVTFNGVPAAKVPSSYNVSEAATQTRVAYGVATTNGHVTWSQWCATCHGNMHSSGNYVHPVDQQLSGTIITNYNSYVKSGDTTGVAGTAFSSLAPFATNSSDYTALATAVGSTAGPVSGDQVICLSCHRAHATGFPEMLRWNMENEFMVTNGVYQTTTRGRSASEAAAGYYDRPATQFATNQRVYCNKCHLKD